MIWAFQALVVALTAALWWAARRDLTRRAADERAPGLENWAQLRVTVEQLTVELERRAVVAEQRVYEAEQCLRLVEQRLQAALARAEDAPTAEAAQPLAAPAPLVPAAPAASAPLTAPLLLPSAAAKAHGTSLPPLPVLEEATLPFPASPQSAPTPPPALTPEDARYRAVAELADAGHADAAEIARQTGLPRGEVELVLSLRARRTG